MKPSHRNARMCALALALLAVPGCGEFCTQEARPSLEVEVVDAQGETVPVAIIDFTVDGGASQRVSCAASSDGCEAVWVGSEDAGTFFLKAKTPEDATGTATVVVDEDECHVLTEQLRIVVE